MNIENLKSEIVIDDETTLRLRGLDQALATLELINPCREYLREYLPWVDGTQTVEDCEEYIQNCLDRFQKKENAVYGIYYNSKLVGIVSFVSISKSNYACEIGYWLGEQFQGKGIMTRAVIGLVNHAFYDIDLHRIVIRAAVENSSSWVIPERLGFTYEGILFGAELVNGKFLNLRSYSLINSGNTA